MRRKISVSEVEEFDLELTLSDGRVLVFGATRAVQVDRVQGTVALHARRGVRLADDVDLEDRDEREKCLTCGFAMRAGSLFCEDCIRADQQRAQERVPRYAAKCPDCGKAHDRPSSCPAGIGRKMREQEEARVREMLNRCPFCSVNHRDGRCPILDSFATGFGRKGYASSFGGPGFTGFKFDFGGSPPPPPRPPPGSPGLAHGSRLRRG